jgi:DNA-binding NarL/FixJ family response regulator
LWEGGVVDSEGRPGIKRIGLVEDHRVFREAFAYVLGLHPDLKVVAQAGALAEGRLLAAVGEFDVAIVDPFLPDGDETDLIGELRQANPRASVMVLTISLDPAKHTGAREAGADEVLTKDLALDRIVDTVRRLCAEQAGEGS